MLNSYKPYIMTLPERGGLAMPDRFVIPAAGFVDRDYNAEQRATVIDNIQSVFIDNTLNTAAFRLTFFSGDNNHNAYVPAYGHAVLPVSAPVGGLRVRAESGAGANVPVTFFNIPQPYYVWAPADGALVVPPLTNLVLNITPLVVGDNILVPASPGLSVRVYRLIASAENPVYPYFTTDPGGAQIMGPSYLGAGGGLTLQASGVPWFATDPGDALVMVADQAVNFGGILGYVQA